MRNAALAIAPDRHSRTIGERAVVFDQSLERFPAQIESVEGGIAALKRRHRAQRLRIVVEAAERGQATVQRALAGVPEWWMAEVVRERERLGEILVKAERTRKRAADLGDLQRMGEPGAEMVALVEHEDLRLVREAA